MVGFLYEKPGSNTKLHKAITIKIKQMEDLFLALMLISLVCFLISWLAPKIFYKLFRKESKALVRTTFGLATIMFFVAFGVMSDKNKPDSLKEADRQENQTEQTQVVAETKNEASAEPAKPLTTTDELWNALDKSIKTRTNYDVKYDEATKEATLIFSPKDIWDENSAVRGAYSSLVKYGKEAFQVEGVNSLTVNYKLEFTDRYGKKSTDDAVIISMSKEEFNKFDWDNLKFQPVYNQIKASASKYYVHPALESKLDYSKLYLAL